MTTTSILTEEQRTLMKPDEGVMINRDDNPQLGFDRSALRQELAPVRQLGQGQKYVEEGTATFLSGESDLPGAPTAEGEVYGNVDLVRVTGGRQEIPRYTEGFSVDVEEQEVSDSHIMDMRDGILELFDLAADYHFFQGMQREDGTDVFKGVFHWLQDNMPSDNIIDCSEYDPSSGDLNGIPANIILDVAYGEVGNHYMTETWDVAAAKPSVWKTWNQVGTFDGATIQSQWEVVSRGQDEAGVGVRRRMSIPPTIGMPVAPDENDSLQLDITMPSRENDGYSSPLDDGDDDVMFLIPQHNGDFYELYEQGSPDVRGPINKEGWKQRFEYKWRAGPVYGQNGHKFSTDIARDVVKLENVSALFDSE